jgi:protein TonB
MKNLFLLLFICFSLPALGQALIMQTKKLEHPYSKEVFYVLEADNTIKSGEYKKYFHNKKVAEQGRVEANQRVGTWQYYNPQGTLEQQYNWTTKTFESAQPFTGLDSYWVEENGVFVNKEPDERPVLLGGTPVLHQYIMSRLRYPAQALRSGKAGVVYISATITPEGQMIDEKVDKGLGSGLEEEALRVFKTIDGEWIPGKVNGKPVNTKIIWPFRFGLQ